MFSSNSRNAAPLQSCSGQCAGGLFLEPAGRSQGQCGQGHEGCHRNSVGRDARDVTGMQGTLQEHKGCHRESVGCHRDTRGITGT